MNATDQDLTLDADNEHPRPAKGETPGFLRRHRRALLSLVGGVAALGFFYYVVPQIAGLGPTLKRLRGGDLWWLGLGIVLEALSFGGDVALFRGVFAARSSGIGWRTSNEIMLAGAAATKLVATAGAGGVAITVWALRGFGLPGAQVATGMMCYEILTYGVYMISLVIGGFGLYLGLFAGRAPFGITVVPATFGAVVILVVLSMLFIEEPVERFLLRRAGHASGRWQRWWRRAAALPRSIRTGLQAALAMVKRRDPSVLGAVAAWYFDIGTLWASFHAFGHAPSPALIVMGYFVGTLANVLPLPGGIGGVEGGMIGCFIAFGVPAQLAVLAVLAYRTISYWLPTIPGAVAYFRLREAIGAARKQSKAT
jgi:putative heme transporter